MVVAPKATAPFFPHCGLIAHQDWPLPHPVRSAQHQKDCQVQGIFRHGPTTSERLSEGVTPASFILQEKYSGTSTDEWTIAVFDILLVLADSYEDAKNHH